MKPGKKLNVVANTIIHSAVENAVTTVFIEKSVEQTIESFISVAFYSVRDVIEANKFDLTEGQILKIERDTAEYAKEVFHLH